VVQPEVWYGAGPSAQFPELDGPGVAPMAGPAYRYDASSTSLIKWPQYFDGVPIFYEWSRDALFEFRLDANGNLGRIRRLLPDVPLANPIDVEFGPDGALYMLEYGDGYNAENPEAKLSRLDFVRGNSTPVPVVGPAISFAAAPPFTVQLTSEGTSDPDGDAITLSWDFDQDGVIDSTDPSPAVTYERIGNFGPALHVVDATGRTATAAVRVVVGNTPPRLTFLQPVLGQPFTFGQALPFEIAVEDDQPVNCNRMTVEYGLGHAMHAHWLSTAIGCSGTFQTPPLDVGHAGTSELVFGAVRATYQDAPGAGLPVLGSVIGLGLAPTGPGVPDPGAGAPDGVAPDAGAPGTVVPDAVSPDAGAVDAGAP
jgi:PKD repeat protein